MRTEPVGVNMWTDDGEPRAAARASAFSIRFCATELAQEGDAAMGETATQEESSFAMQKQKFASWQRKKRRRAARKPRQNCAAWRQ